MSENTPRKTHRRMVDEWKQYSEFNAAYGELEIEFTGVAHGEGELPYRVNFCRLDGGRV